MDELRKRAKDLRSIGKYAEAIEIYKMIYLTNCDKWLAWEYADSLKKCNDIDTAISICKDVYENNKFFKYNNDLYSWLLYERYYKKPKEIYQFEEVLYLYDTAIFVTKLVSQNVSSPYESIIIQTLKLINKHCVNQWDKIIKLIDKLDLLLISDKPLIYKKQEREMEYQSNREMLYVYKAKALLELNQYDECINCCIEALNVINQFHHDNDIWIRLKQAKSIAGLGDVEEGIKLIYDLSLKKLHWDLFYELAKLYIIRNDLHNAILYCCRAAITKDPPKMKVTLFYDMANIYIKLGNKELSRLHCKYACEIRKSENWNIPYNLSDLFNKTGSNDTNIEVSDRTMHDLWVSEIYNILGKKLGVVTKVQPHGKTGFILCDKDSFYFKTSSVIDKCRIKQGDNVAFCLLDSYDHSKNKVTKEAGIIKLVKRER